MVSRAMARQSQSNLPLVLFGFTGAGLVLAAAVTAFFYFGSQFLEKSDSPSLATAEVAPVPSELPTAQPTSPDAPLPAASNVASLVEGLSEEQLSTVQKMLVDRQRVIETEAETTLENDLPAPDDTDELLRLQGLVDGFSVQGIRKAGKETRVFLNGRIHRLGDVVDVASGLSLIGFNEFELIFQDAKGHRFTKPI